MSLTHGLGNSSHIGYISTYSNPGTFVVPVGVKVFPLKGHALAGWYVYRSMVDTSLLETRLCAGTGRPGGFASRSTTALGANGCGPSIRTSIFAWRAKLPFQAGAIETSRSLADCDPNTVGVQSVCWEWSHAVRLTSPSRTREIF